MEETQFLRTLSNILDNGKIRMNRTGVRTLSIFSPPQLSFSLKNNKFPLLTTRQLSLRSIFEELMWFLRGQTDVTSLQQKKVNIWNANSTREFLDQQGLHHLEEYDVGPTYGFQFRHSGAEYMDCKTKYKGKGVDQLQYVIDLLQNDPFSRRIIIDLWCPRDIDQCALPPCLFSYQFYVSTDKFLSCKITQRSSDISLAGGWNIASAALLVYMLAHITDLKPGTLYWSIGDAHIYENQVEAVRAQLNRKPKPFPLLHIIKSRDNITDFEYTDFTLSEYVAYPKISIQMNA